MKFNTITFTNMAMEAYDQLFSFLYENKCVSEPADENDGTMSITIYTGIEKIEFYEGSLTLISETYDSISFHSDMFYKVSII